MTKGDELARKQALILYHLYERGAIASNSAADGLEIQEVIDADDEDFKSLRENLSRANLLVVKDWSWQAGEASGGQLKLWLTAAGFEQAKAIAGRFRADTEASTKESIGFRLPDNDK